MTPTAALKACDTRPAGGLFSGSLRACHVLTGCQKELESDVTLSCTVLRLDLGRRGDCEGLRMSQLVRSTPRWSVMILIPGGGLAGRAIHRVPIAARWLARSFEWFGSQEPRLSGCLRPGHQRADEVRIDRREPPSEAPTGGRCLPNLKQAPPLARHRAKISSPNRLSALFKLLSRGWRGISIAQRCDRRRASERRQAFKEPELQVSLRVTSAASEDIAWHYGAAS
ncbi:hypothetical protein ACVIIV_003357 [Bradyrhizobium sp. USDA 4354]